MKKTTRIVTGAVIIAAIILIVGYDIFIAIEPTTEDTISRVFLDFATNHPIIPLAFGVLSGHLLWPSANAGEYRPVRLSILAIIGAVVLVLDIIGHIPPIPVELPLFLGIPIGHLCWPQYRGDSQKMPGDQ